MRDDPRLDNPGSRAVGSGYTDNPVNLAMMCSRGGRQDGWVTLFLGQLENLVAPWKDVQRSRPRVSSNILVEPKAEEPSDLHLEGQGTQRPFFTEIGKERTSVDNARSSPRTGTRFHAPRIPSVVSQ